MSWYSRGREVLSGEVSGPVVVIRLKDPEGLVKSQGAAASAAFWVAPEATTNKAYQTVAAQIGNALHEKNVNADVTVLDAAPQGSPLGYGKEVSFAGGAIFGASALGLVLVALNFLKPAHAGR